MKNLMKQIAMSLGLILMLATLVVISANPAQAKVKKQTGNSAKVKSHAKRLSVSNGFTVDIGTSENSKSRAKRAPAALGGADSVTINNLTGIASKRVRRTTKHTR